VAQLFPVDTQLVGTQVSVHCTLVSLRRVLKKRMQASGLKSFSRFEVDDLRTIVSEEFCAIAGGNRSADIYNA